MILKYNKKCIININYLNYNVTKKLKNIYMVNVWTGLKLIK